MQGYQQCTEQPWWDDLKIKKAALPQFCLRLIVILLELVDDEIGDGDDDDDDK